MAHAREEYLFQLVILFPPVLGIALGLANGHSMKILHIRARKQYFAPSHLLHAAFGKSPPR